MHNINNYDTALRKLFHVLYLLFLQNIDVSIDLPATLLQDAGIIDENNTSVFISIFRDGHLFPTTASKHSDSNLAHGNWTVASCVVSVSVGQYAQECQCVLCLWGVDELCAIVVKFVVSPCVCVCVCVCMQ